MAKLVGEPPAAGDGARSTATPCQTLEKFQAGVAGHRRARRGPGIPACSRTPCNTSPAPRRWRERARRTAPHDCSGPSQEARRLAAELATLPTDERGCASTAASPPKTTWVLPPTPRQRHRRPAFAAYTGIVFKRTTRRASAADFEYAQEHLNITSFLYGVLRSLTPSAPTGSKATPCCPATTNRRLPTARTADALLDKIRRDDGILSTWPAGR